jgi:hypothetical protein
LIADARADLDFYRYGPRADLRLESIVEKRRADHLRLDV